MAEGATAADGVHGPFDAVMGFDFGGRRIGVAVGQRILGTAQALEVVANTQGGGIDWPRIEQLVKTWRPNALVVGLPLTMEGDRTETTNMARGFARQLRSRIGLPVFEHDERLTSIEANRRFAEGRSRGQRKAKDATIRDAIAAQIIVESFLAEQSRATIRASGDDSAP